MSPKRRESRIRSVDDLMEDVGEQIGRVAASAVRGVQEIASASHDGKLTERAEEIVKRLESGVGSLASSANEGFQRMAGRAREEYEEERRNVGDTRARSSKRKKAGDAAKRAGHRIGEMAGAASHGIRRVVARAREEYDDIRAEAEVKRGGGGAPPDRS